LRNAQSEDYMRLYNDFRWIAGVAGRKIHELDSSALTPRQRAHAVAHIVEEARTFASIAVESLLGHRHTANDGGMNAADESTTESISDPNVERLPVSVNDEPDSDDGEQARLDRIVGFVARQEPQVCWAVGDRSDGTTVLACDLAFGWIPPRIALPVDVELLAPAASRNHAGIEELLGGVTRVAVYRPGCAMAKATELLSIPAPRASPPIRRKDLIGQLIRDASNRAGIAPAVRAAITALAAGNPVAAIGLQGVVAHVDAARRQLLSDYPLLDESVLGDCLLLCAIESSLLGDGAAATYHYRWFESVYGDGQ
jgi:Family of unknown function (DUF5632)